MMGDGLFVRCTVVQRLSSMRDSQGITTTIRQSKRLHTSGSVLYDSHNTGTRSGKVVLKGSILLAGLGVTERVLVTNPVKLELDILGVVLIEVWVSGLHFVLELIQNKRQVLVLSNLLH